MSRTQSTHAGVVTTPASQGPIPAEHMPPKPEDAKQGEAKQSESKHGEASSVPAPSPDTIAKQSEEERIAHQRLVDLQTSASASAGHAQEAQSKLLGVEGDLARAQGEINELRRENEALRNANAALVAGGQRDGLPTLSVELPRGAFQLLESVTVATVPSGPGQQPAAARAKRGDVVFVGGKPNDVEKLQRDIGQASRVYVVDESSAAELRKLGYVR